MKVVIFAGGYGTRFSEETTLIPKPLIEVNGRPILRRIMDHYQDYGFDDFIICLGYKGNMIKDYFLNLKYHESDLLIDIGNSEVRFEGNTTRPFKVQLVDTGLDTSTAGRLKRVMHLTNNESFMLTYGDGLSDINLYDLIRHHNETKAIVTMTTVNPSGKYGAITFDESSYLATTFAEKRLETNSWINAGFFVIDEGVIEYLKGNMDSVMWEEGPLPLLCANGELSVFTHNGFWKCMDNKKDKIELEKYLNQ